jgi:hypothetical protein
MYFIALTADMKAFRLKFFADQLNISYNIHTLKKYIIITPNLNRRIQFTFDFD